MKVTLLGEKAFERLTPIIHDHFPDTIINTNDPLTGKLIETTDLFISYGYRHIITPDMLKKMKRPPVNLHISLLPWNRGADPNFWSWLDDTPKGVSIHLIDDGVDTGKIIIDYEVVPPVPDDMTLRSSYDYLCKQVECKFESLWPMIRMGGLECTDGVHRFMLKKQEFNGVGTVHKKSDIEKYRDKLSVKGWDTPVSEVRTWKN